MGAGQSDLYKGTYGDNPDNIPDALKGDVKLPEGEAQLKHIFADRDGHLPDTKENRKRLVELANDMEYYLGTDMRGIDWHACLNKDGTQDWVRHLNQTIINGGRNAIPRLWNKETGLNNNPLRRKKK